jgi:hypothetical protein
MKLFFAPLLAVYLASCPQQSSTSTAAPQSGAVVAKTDPNVQNAAAQIVGAMVEAIVTPDANGETPGAKVLKSVPGMLGNNVGSYIAAGAALLSVIMAGFGAHAHGQNKILKQVVAGVSTGEPLAPSLSSPKPTA